LKNLDSISADSRLLVTTKDGMIITTDGNNVLRVQGTYNGGDKPHLNFHTIRNTTDNPAMLQPGDYGMNVSFTTCYYEHGNDIGKSIASLIPQVDHNADMSQLAPASNLNVLVNSGDENGEYANIYRVWRFNKTGAIESKIFQCFTQSTEDISKITPENGMIIYNTDIDKFQGYANGQWVDLH